MNKPKGATRKPAQKLDGLEYVMCRTRSAGVFAGHLKKEEGHSIRNPFRPCCDTALIKMLP